MADAKLRVLEIPSRSYDAASGLGDLDAVTAFLQDFEPGRGQLTLVCWGRAWTHYWGSMGNGSSLAEFVLKASPGYVVGKLMLTRDVLLARAERREERWLAQIVDALKDELRKASGSAS